jgi:SAM-dependent methyltransferase
MKQKKEWFQDWFNTSYYHLLYDYRNEEEAEFFMENLLGFLNLGESDVILDLPCGRGRHSLFLNSKGYRVVGADISEKSIAHARHFENQRLRFAIHDMRDPLGQKFKAIFNLFTSFGYFENEETNARVLKNFKNALLDDGRLVIDFLNLSKVKQQLVPRQEVVKNGIQYKIEKKITSDFIVKDIEVNDQGRVFNYQEKVQALDLKKFERYSSEAGLEITQVFGDYSLGNYSEEISDRLILVMK